MIAPNLIIPYFGTNATIPDGYERVTSFDSKIVKGSLTSLGTTGGSTTHSHIGIAHSHSMNSHAHTSNTTTSTVTSPSDDASDGSGAAGEHSHSIDITSASFSGGNLSDIINYGSISNIPLYIDVIFIKATTYSLIPSNCAVWSLENRTNGTIYGQGRYLRGASTGADAGGTGGSSTHAHSASHTHTATIHSHSGTTSTQAGNWGGSGTIAQVTGPHAHQYTISESLTGNAYSGNSNAVSNDPLSKQINLWKFSSQQVVKVGDIAITTESTNPLGWIDCDGTNGTPDTDGFYVKNTSSYSSTATQTGSNTHAHSGNSHSHSQSHNHGGTATTSTVNASTITGVGSARAVGTHNHQITNISTVTATWSTTTMSTQTSNNEPPYIKAKYVMATASALGSGSAFFLFEAC